jgi:hypothetical protein
MSTAEHALPLPDDDGHHRADPAPATVVVTHERRATPSVTIQQAATGGLTGVWATVANLSFGTIIAGLVILMYRDISANMKDNQTMFREEMRLQRAEALAQREADARRTEALVSEFRTLASEIRASRLSIERAERSITQPKE